ncbi:hypothetical protein ABEP00_00210 [Heyndrickxia sporothermodurans]|nr:hypothetical protein [Heyndrickxia sporothermodurans]
MTNFMLGIDIGMTSTKAVLFSGKGKIRNTGNYYPFPFTNPKF